MKQFTYLDVLAVIKCYHSWASLDFIGIEFIHLKTLKNLLPLAQVELVSESTVRKKA